MNEKASTHSCVLHCQLFMMFRSLFEIYVKMVWRIELNADKFVFQHVDIL